MISSSQVMAIHLKQLINGLSPYDISWYYKPNKLDDEISPNTEKWLNQNGFNWPMTEEQEVEFKLKFL